MKDLSFLGLASRAIGCRRFATGSLLGLAVLCAPASGDDAATVSFRSDIAPILLESCLACHGPKKAEGGYRVDTYDELLKAGDSGELPIAASLDHVSELVRRIISDDESERMPAENDALPPAQVQLIKTWVAAGGKFDGKDSGLSLSLVMPPVRYADPPEVYSQAVPITATTFSPDGKQIVTSGYHELAIWNTEDATLVRRIQNIGQRVFALAFSSDGQTLAVGCGQPGRSGEVRLVDFNSGDVKEVIARTNDVVLDLAYRPGTNDLAIASADSTIRIINTETLKEIRAFASHADWVTAVAWSDDGTRLASASRDKSVKVYDGTTGDLLSSYLGHGAAVRGVSILADSKQVVSVGADNKLHRWNIEGAKKVAEVGTGGEGSKIVRSGTNLWVPCSDKRLLQIDLTSNKISQQYSGHSDWVLTACFQPSTTTDGEESHSIASGSFDGEVRLWNIADAAVIRQWVAKP
ncbi:WD40 domain-containing protein [Rubripirellula lacrimiformis]|uniref:WD40 domain-containing protein n=1 Tax=Rubripirellula lacrimiformis TaxID=1930273 RepID=UPI001C54C474|nr:c-type cytochrome domain-containing protein [Rubripirellula lacrimiformis]